MNEFDQSEVGYQTSSPEAKTKPRGNRQFPGNKMPQGNKMQAKKKVPNKTIKKADMKEIKIMKKKPVKNRKK